MTALYFLFFPPLSVLTGSLVSFCNDVGSHHGAHPQQAHRHGDKVHQPVASLQQEPGKHHQHGDHKAVQQLQHTVEHDG